MTMPRATIINHDSYTPDGQINAGRGGASGMLAAMNPRFIQAEYRKYPDHILGACPMASWPELDGVVMLACTSRTGSTFVSRYAERHFHLERVGESLNPIQLELRRNSWKKRNFQEALHTHIQRRAHKKWYMFKAGGVGLTNAVRMGFLDHYRKIIRPIFLLRQDILAQTISLFCAQKSQNFHATHGEGYPLTEADYDFDRIENLLMTILRGNQTLAQAITALPIQPVILTYESFRDGNTDSLSEALGKTGLPERLLPTENRTRWVMRRTHDMTDIYRTRFEAEMGIRSYNAIADHEYLVDLWCRHGLTQH